MSTLCEVEHLHQPGGWLSPGWLEVGTDGRILSVSASPPPGRQAERLRGFGVPGLSNLHSHAFQRAQPAAPSSSPPPGPRTTCGPGARRCTGWWTG